MSRKRFLRYRFRDRYSCDLEFANKREAIRQASAEARDGWPVKVIDMRDDRIVWSIDPREA